MGLEIASVLAQAHVKDFPRNSEEVFLFGSLQYIQDLSFSKTPIPPHCGIRTIWKRLSVDFSESDINPGIEWPE